MDFQNILTNSLSQVLIALLGLAIAYLVNFLNKQAIKVKEQTKNIADEGKRNLVNDAIDRINKLVTVNVSAVEVSLAKAIRESVADGKVDKSELKGLANVVLDQVKGQASDDVLNFANESIGDIEGYILATIEKELAKIKGQI